MMNVIRLKSSHCIEWSLSVPLNYSAGSRISDNFLLRDTKCNLRCEFHGSSQDGVYCESNLSLNPAVDIIAIVTSENGANSYSLSNGCFKRTKFTGQRQEIWRNNAGYHLRSPITVEVITHEVHISKEEQPEASSSKAAPQKSQRTSYLEKNPHYQAFSRDFSKLLEGNSSFDVVIKCEETKFNAHRIVLGSRSVVFSTMLKSNMIEGKTGFINIEDIKKSTFEHFLRYLYTAMLPDLSIESAKELYKVGDKYAVEELKKACSEFLNKNLSEGNACELLVLADLHSDEDFRKKVISYIVEKKIPQNDRKWSDFCSCHSNLAIEILNIYIQKRCPK